MNGPHKMIILFQRPEGQDTEKKYKPRGPQNSKNPSKQPNPPIGDFLQDIIIPMSWSKNSNVYIYKL